MLKAVIDHARCEAAACEKCAAREACDVKAIVKLDKDGSAAIITHTCYGCGKCVPVCVGSAITMKEL